MTVHSKTFVTLLPLMAIAVILFGGCAAYDYRFNYEPRPIEVNAPDVDGADSPAVHMLASIIGVRRAQKKEPTPAAVDVAILIDNNSSRPISFDPSTLSLHAANLHKFPPPVATPSGTSRIEPGDSLEVSALFPFPGDRVPGSFDLSGLNLRWALEQAGQRRYHSAAFARAYRDYYDHAHWHVGVGYPYHYRFGYYWNDYYCY